jgi:ubiquinone/menaquinone biosynthesis C-methylase UbiE
MFNRKAHWENVYETKSPLEVSWYQKTPSLSLTLIEHAQLYKDAAIIDVGGGASMLVDHLYDQSYTNLAVLDISKKALEHAQQRLGKAAQKIHWYEADITEFKCPQTFDLWHDRAVFHFLTHPADRQNYIKNLKTVLKPKGQLIVAAFALGGPEKCSGLDIVQYDAKKLLNVLGEAFELLEQHSELHLTPAHKEQAFSFFRLRYSA